MDFKPKGVCSTSIHIETQGDIISRVDFTGGCSGNLQGISRLLPGMKIDDVIDKLSGIRCGPRPTSCPDQLAIALKKLKKSQ